MTNTTKNQNCSTLHKLNVFLYDLYSVNDVTLTGYAILVFFLNFDISFKWYIILTLGVAIGWFVSEKDIENKIGLFVHYRNIKEYNDHVFIDLILYLGFGYLFMTAIIEYLYNFQMWVFFVVPVSTIQLLLIAYIVAKTMIELSDKYRKAMGIGNEEEI